MAKRPVCAVRACGTKLHAGKEAGDFCYPCAAEYDRCRECLTVTRKVLGELPLCAKCLRKMEEARKRLIRSTMPKCEVSTKAKDLFK